MDYREMGNKYYYEKKYDKAIENYKKALKEEESQNDGVKLTIWYNMIACYIGKENFSTAIFLCTKVEKDIIKNIEIDKDNKQLMKLLSKFYFNKAFSYLKINEERKALMYFNRADSFYYDGTTDKVLPVLIKNISKN